MYLERVRTKGKTYLYLKKYFVRDNYSNNTMTIYGFGRIDQALKQMYRWKHDLSTLPDDLKHEGCCTKDLDTWIATLETGLHKSGRSFVIQTDIFDYM